MSCGRRAVALTAGMTLARHLVGLWQLRRTLTWMDSPQPRRCGGGQPSPASSGALHLILPVLWEQDHVAVAVRWFSRLVADLPQVTLTVVTSAREDTERERIADLIVAAARPPTAAQFPQLSAAVLTRLQAVNARDRAAVLAILDGAGTTHAAVQRALARELLAGGDQARLRHLHYPGSGRKAAQVNYAAAQIRAPGHDYLLVYDVDSRPGVALLTATMDLIRARTAEGCRPQVVQQPSIFLPERDPDGSASMLGSGAALVQTLWTLRREIPALRRYTRSRRSRLPWALAQTPGHGLAVRIDVFARLGGLPEQARLDDLAFGFTVSAHRIGVDVVSAVTIASSPGQGRAVIAQHRRWFAGYLDYPGQFRRARRAGAPPIACVTALTVGGYRAGMWLAAGPATAACTLALVHPRCPAATRLLAGAALVVGCAAPLPLLARHRPTGAQLALSPGPASLVVAAGQVWMAYLIRSLGPAAALATVWRVEPDALAGRTARRPAGAGR